MDFAKFKNSKALKIGLAIAIPTVLVGAYFGYKFIKKNYGTPKGKGEVTAESKHQNKIVFTKS